MLQEDEVPFNTFYGDGCPIEPSVLDELRDAYARETRVFTWQEGDILMLDNMLTAHVANLQRVLAALSDEEKQQLHALTGKLLANLQPGE